MASKDVEIKVKVNVEGEESLKNLQTFLTKIESEPVQLNIETKTDALKKIKDFKDSLDDVGKAGKEGGDKASKGIRSIGDALKTLGIVTIIFEGFQKLKEAFLANGQVAEKFQIVTAILNKVLSDLVNLVVNNVSTFTDFFSNPLKYVKEFSEIVDKYVLEKVKDIITGFGLLGSALNKLFKGDFEGALKDAQEGLIKTNVILNVGRDAINGISKAVSTATDSLSKYAKETINAATANVKLLNSAQELAAQAEKRLVKLETLAEKERQIRDDESVSIEERIAANDRLIKINQERLKQAKIAGDAAVLEAKQNLALNNSKENRIALINAEAAALSKSNSIQTDITETVTEGNNLRKDELELIQMGIKGNNDRTASEKAFTASLEKETIKRLKLEREALDESFKIEEQRLLNKLNSLKKGTLAYVETEEELKNLRSIYSQQTIKNDKDTTKANEDNQKASLDFRINNLKDFIGLTLSGYDEYKALLTEQEEQIKNNTNLTEQQKTEALRANALARLEIERQSLQDKIDVGQKALDAVIGFTNQESDVNKAALILKQVLAAAELALDIKSTIALAKETAKKATLKGAEATVDSASGLAKTAAALPFPGNIPLIIGYAAQALGIITAVKAAVSKAGGNSPSVSNNSATAASIPQVTLVGQGNNLNSNVPQQQQPIPNIQNNVTVKAVVSETEITNSQEFINKVKNSASI